MPPEDDNKDDGKEKPAHVFKTDDDFLKAAGSRFDGKVKAAAKAAREAATADLLKVLGVDDPAQLEDIKVKLASADSSLSEVERHKAENARLTKKLTESEKHNAELGGFKSQVIKEKALAPHLSKIHPDLRGLVSENLLSKLTVDGDKVTAADGKDIGAYIDELTKATPSLKAPATVPGAGTKGAPTKVPGTNGEDKRTAAQKITDELIANEAARRTAAGTQ